MSRSKYASYVVQTTREQAARWEALAKYQGHRTVGTWLATLATEKVRQLGKLVPHKPLEWHCGIFHATLTDLNAVPIGTVSRRVTGRISGVFGIYRGGSTTTGLDSPGSFTLVHVPTGRQLCTLPRLRDCKTVARQLAALKKMAWNETDPEKVVGDDGPTARTIIGQADRAAKGEGEDACRVI